MFINNLTLLADFSFPVTRDDLRSIVHNYLQSIGRKVPKFKNNWSDLDWCWSFLKRHPILSLHSATNEKGDRIVGVTAEILVEYVNNLEVTLQMSKSVTFITISKRI